MGRSSRRPGSRSPPCSPTGSGMSSHWSTPLWTPTPPRPRGSSSSTPANPSRSWISSTKPKAEAEKELPMSNKAYKLIELVGTSSESFAKAADAAVERASSTLHNLDWFEVTELRGRIAGGKIAEYQVKMKVGFRLD